MEEYTIERVTEAINILYNNHEAQKKSQANTWLDAFLASSNAWSVAFHLLQHPSVEVSYFCANLLLTKVHRDWNQLDASGKSFFEKSINEKLALHSSNPSSPPLVLNRLCLVASAIALRLRESSTVDAGRSNQLKSVDSLVQYAVQLLQSATYDDKGFHSSVVALQILLALAEETEHLDSGFRAQAIETLTVSQHFSAPKLKAFSGVSSPKNLKKE